MSSKGGRTCRWYREMVRGQHGITGLETAIILIAFIVVASVFAFAVLQVGFFATEKARETGRAGITEVKSTLSPKTPIVLEGNGTNVTKIIFTVTNTSAADPVRLDSAGTLVRYVDDKNNYSATGDVSLGLGVNGISWVSSWKLGAPTVVDAGEVVDITVTVSSLPSDKLLVANTQFTITLIPTGAPELSFSPTTPIQIKNGIMTLK